MAKILIAENELALREFVARGLARRGHKVTAADDGATAFEILRGEAFDLLLTDIDMPIMDGIALTQSVGPVYPNMKIVIMSGHEHQLERAQGMSNLVTRVVPKPFSIAEICQIIEDVTGAPSPRRRGPNPKRTGDKQ